PNSRGWSTHDCTTLGGNSGSVVLDMQTGKAVALHFAGLYMIENYAVPASMIHSYLKAQPWNSGGEGTSIPATPANVHPNPPDRRSTTPDFTPGPKPLKPSAPSDRGSVTITVPLVITVSLGAAQSGGLVTNVVGGSQGPTIGGRVQNIEEAARQLFRERQVGGIYSIWPGYEIQRGRLS